MLNRPPVMFSVFRKYGEIYIIPVLTLVAVLYSTVLNNQLTNWDDELYILYNPFLTSLSFENIKEIFTTYYAGNYHPLTLISLAIDFKIGGADPWPYQLTNLILHLFNTLLVYVFIKSLIKLRNSDLKYSAFIPVVVAFLFGIHTLQVESVAWISERKNVLYTLFFFSSLILYIKYLNSFSYKSYSFTIVLFILSLLSKGMAVPLSLCIICIDYFAGRNLLSRKVILEKIPFLILSLIFGIVAILAQQTSNSIRTDNNFAWFERVALAGYGFIQYIIKLCFPYQLSAFYPYPVKLGSIPDYYYYVYILLVMLFFFVLWRYFRHNRIVVFGTLFFIANISIVIQLLPVGDAVIADRYMYVASIGFFIIFGYVCNILWQRGAILRYLTILTLILYGFVLSYQTHHRVGVWKDSITLWNDALEKFPENNDRAYQNRGNKLLEMGNITAALEDYKRLLEIDPKNTAGYIGMGHIKYASKDFQGALNDLNTALALYKTYEGYITRAVLKMDMQDYTGALADSDSAYQLNPHGTGTLVNKGYIFLQMGNYEAAIKNYSHVLQLDSLNSKAYKGRALAKKAMNDMFGALSDLNRALLLNPSYEGYIDRAIVKMAVGDYQGARSDLHSAHQLYPFNIEVYINRGIIELNTGNHAEALREFNSAVAIDSGSSYVYLYRAIANVNLANYKDAIEDLSLSIKIQPSADAFYHRGIAYIRSGRKTKGCTDLQQSSIMGHSGAKTELEKSCKQK